MAEIYTGQQSGSTTDVDKLPFLVVYGRMTISVDMAKERESQNWVNFGVWMAERRQSLKLTQEQLGDLVGVGKEQIYRIEKGISTKRSTVIKIARSLNVHPDRALAIAYGIPDRSEQRASEQEQEAALAAELIKDFWTMTPERKAQVVAFVKILKDDHPEILNILNPPVKFSDISEIENKKDAKVIKDTESGSTPPEN